MSVARPIPVFRPTAEEFSDFSKYVTSIEPIAEQYGICKIVPPEGWRPRVSSYDDLNIEIPCPIRQFVHGKQGVYQVVNVMEKPMTLAQFKQASEDQFAKCFPKSKREGSDAEKFDIEELERRFWKNLTFHAPLYGADMLGTLFEDLLEEGDVLEHASKENDANGGEGEIDVVQVEIANDEPPAKGKKKPQQQQRSPKRKRGADTATAAVSSGTADADADADADTTTAPVAKSPEIAKRNAWNLGHLDTLLSQRLGKLLPGVTSPYLYFGMWKSLFACHTEDMDLYSINFLHFGKPKVWYGVPSAQKHRVDQVARLHFPMQFKECAEFLRHKSSMFSPSILKMGNVSLTHAVQQPGEFIITFPGAYHFGFNAGFNCAEAVNFALQRWLDFGKKAKPCKCVADSVTIDVGMFINMVANGEEVPDVLPAAKKSKGNSTPKPKRIAKRRSREKAATPVATAKVGGRSMGMVTGRMMATPLASAALPQFVEETLGDEDVPALSEEELRSGDENDGGEYLEGSKARQKQAKKPRRSKRMENKRGNTTPSGTTDGSEAPASSKRPKEPARRKKQAKVTTAPADKPSEATPKEEQKPNTPKASTTAAAPKPPARKRAVKRKSAKVADNDVHKKAKGQEPAPDVEKVEEVPVNTREYQGLKIIIRPPRADSSNGSAVPTTDTRVSATTTTGARKQRAGAGKRSTSKKTSPTRKGKKANPDLMPEGKTTAWQQLNADANRLHNRDSAATEPTQVKMGGPESCPGQQAMLVQSTISSFYAPYMTGAAGRQQGAPSYGHFLVGERTQQTEERPQPTQVLQASEAQPLPTLKDFMSQGSYPLLSSFRSSFSTAPPPTGAHDQTVQPGSAYSLALELQRHKLRELREKQQQLQQLRHEQQPQLQQLQQFIHAQRQLQHEPASSSSSSAYSAGRYASGLPPPLPTLPTTTTTTASMPISPLSPFSSTIAAAYGLPLPPSPSTLTSVASSSTFPPPLHYSLPPLPPHLHTERLAPAQAPPDSAGGATTHKLVHILPSPAPASASTLATLYAPRSSLSSSSSASASSVPSSAPVPAPSSFPVSS